MARNLIFEAGYTIEQTDWAQVINENVGSKDLRFHSKFQTDFKAEKNVFKAVQKDNYS